MNTREDLGWRTFVIFRDGGCIAPHLDPGAGPCRDKWGETLPYFGTNDVEVDYVRTGAKGRRHQLAEDHVSLCPGHHRGTGAQAGKVWATSHRRELRDYLDGVR